MLVETRMSEIRSRVFDSFSMVESLESERVEGKENVWVSSDKSTHMWWDASVDEWGGVDKEDITKPQSLVLLEKEEMISHGAYPERFEDLNYIVGMRYEDVDSAIFAGYLFEVADVLNVDLYETISLARIVKSDDMLPVVIDIVLEGSLLIAPFNYDDEWEVVERVDWANRGEIVDLLAQER